MEAPGYAELIAHLEQHDVRPSAQRLAIAGYVLTTADHPTADEVWRTVREHFPMVSRATVYNTLQLFTAKGLLKQFVLDEGSAVYDANVEPHHHFIDDETGVIEDIPWSSLAVRGIDDLLGIDVRDHMVVVRGNRSPSSPPSTTDQSSTTDQEDRS